MIKTKLRPLSGSTIQLVDGDRGVNYPNKKDFSDNGFCLFLDSSNLTKNGFDFSSKVFISKNKDEAMGNGKLKRGDLVMNTRGTIGNMGVYQESVPYEDIRINSGMLIIRGGADYDNGFLYGFFRSNLFYKQVENIMSGSVQSQLPIWIFNFIQVPELNIPAQQKISAVLSVLDSKIELNNRINAELEQMAKALYDYWFIQFDFPDQNGKPYKTSGGKMVWNEELKRDIPEGWGIKKISDLLPVLTGKQDANFATENGKYNFFTCGEQILKCDSFEFEGKSVLVAGNGNFNIKLYEGKFNAYQRTYVLIPEDEKYYTVVYLAVKDRIASLTKGSRGSIVKFITKGDLEDIQIPLPKDKNLDVFSTLNIITKKIEKNLEENQKLSEHRDWLLPMLMNGQVKVA